MMTKRPLELYIHIPFCAQKCLYCDFLSFLSDEDTKTDYMKALFREIETRAVLYRDYQITSVFIGGGTPSVMEVSLLQQMMEKIIKSYDMKADCEITIEVNPGTVNQKQLQLLYKMGINRLSIGMQSANNQMLQVLGRIHTYEQFLETYQSAVEVGFQNINVDIMGGLPGQELADYINGVEKVVALNPKPQHISAYSLIVEENTPFALLQRQGKLCLPEEDCERDMYWKTDEILTGAGYHHYEISNYALDGYECAHNIGYWKRRDYLGFGIGAASLVDNVRFHNSISLEDYLKAPLQVREQEQYLTKKEQMEEFLFRITFVKRSKQRGVLCLLSG